MNARLLARLDDIRASYWFIPSLMVLGAIVLSFVTTGIDGVIGPDWIEQVSWLYANRPEGARGLLSTVAGSMIGVAGVTFSITIASVVYASGQYGPRLLTNFMSDRGNQITLGTFIATFLYCLLVLRTVRAADEASGGSNPAGDVVGEFVPHLAIVTGLGLTLASVGVLIFFIHHVPESIHVSNVIAGIGRDLQKRIDTLFPERIGSPEAAEEGGQGGGLPDGFLDDAVPVRADGSGYIQGVDMDSLIDLACDSDLVVRMQRRPGDFVAVGDALAYVGPETRVSESVERSFQLAFAWGKQRTPLQDTRFLVNELVEIAARALSPGVNDPFTAMSCLDWLSASLKGLTDRTFPEPLRYDNSGTLRLVARPTTFREFVGSVYGQLRPYLSADRNASLHALKTIGEIAVRATSEDQLLALRHEADAIAAGAATALTLAADRESVARRHRTVVRLLTSPADQDRIAVDSEWIGGTA